MTCRLGVSFFVSSVGKKTGYDVPVHAVSGHGGTAHLTAVCPVKGMGDVLPVHLTDVGEKKEKEQEGTNRNGKEILGTGRNGKEQEGNSRYGKEHDGRDDLYCSRHKACAAVRRCSHC